MMRTCLLVLCMLAVGCGDEKQATPARDAGPRGDGAVEAGSAAGDAGAVIASDDQFIRDAERRALVLRGVNIAHTAKRSVDGVPWVDRNAVLRLRKDFGLNVIRLTLFWRFVEPTRGEYDDVYLGRIREILDWAEEGDIHVVLDMHQDLFGFEATDLDEGDGVPTWAHDPSCPAFEDKTPWFSNYFGEPLKCQFTSFWANKDGIQDTFGAMWKHVAEQLGAHPAVVGADLFNEPWLPSNTRKPAQELVPFYDRIIPKLREGAPGLRVFYEPGTLSGSVADQSIPKPDYINMVYAPHYYPAEIFGSTEPYVTNQAALDKLYARHVEDATQAKVALWIGEFGAGASLPNIAQYYRDLNAIWGPDFTGYARWAYDSTKTYDLAMLGDEGQELDHVTSMIEPYAERIPGMPKSTHVDMAAGTLTLALDAELGGELVVSCPARLCGDKRALSLTQADKPLDTPQGRYDPKLGQLRVDLPKGKSLALKLSFGG